MGGEFLESFKVCLALPEKWFFCSLIKFEIIRPGTNIPWLRRLDLGL